MNSLVTDDGRPIHTIVIGEVFASAESKVVRTVLGSCIAVCLRDPVAKIGGMNHYMLPGSSCECVSTRYGVHAMELLINRCMSLGAERSRLEAKVFGGGHVLTVAPTSENVPSINIRFAMQFLKLEGISIKRRDVGGYQGREILFYCDTGRVLLRRIPHTIGTPDFMRSLRVEEHKYHLNHPACEEPDDSNITLFES